MNTTPLLTVLLVTYNHRNSFAEAMESVLCQKTNFAFEIWVLDDCSNDGTSDSVREYAKKHPGKVVPFIRERNLGGIQNVFQAMKAVNTKYFATLEADDRWCCENKLQKQVEILEHNPDCSFCTHNTVTHILGSQNHRMHNHKHLTINTQKVSLPQTREQFILPHYSSRVFRTDCLCLDEIKNPVVVCFDFAQAFWFQSKGKMYYLDEVMSVYNVNFTGVYSGASSDLRRFMAAVAICALNSQFDYTYNKMFLKCIKRHRLIGVMEYFRLKYFTPKEKLPARYAAAQDRYKKKYLTLKGTKRLFMLSIPYLKNKSLCLELRKEKDR